MAAPAVPCLFLAAPAVGQYQAPSEKLFMTAKSADTWAEGDADVVQLEGPVAIEMDGAALSAKQAVVWLSPEKGSEANRQRVQVVLVGDAKVTRDGVVRTGDRMMVNASVAGRVRLTAEERTTTNRRSSALYQLADAIRNPPAAPPATAPIANGAAAVAPAAAVGAAAAATPAPATGPSPAPSDTVPLIPPPLLPPSATSRPTTSPTTATRPTTTTAPITIPGPKGPVMFDAPHFETVLADDGTISVVFNKGAKLIHRRSTGDLVELQADRVVLFTPLRDLPALTKSASQIRQIQDAVTAAYMEGDARVVFTPASMSGEQRLEARQVYYEFTTDRALLTEAVLRTVDPKANIPFTLRAKTIRQLARGEYKAEGAEFSTSAFATPSYSLRAEKVYVRQDQATDPNAAPGTEGNGVTLEDARTTVSADHVQLRTFGVPFFYLPKVGTNLSDQQTALRAIGFENSQMFGPTAQTAWGLFETFGVVPPKDLDAAYRLDYYGDRGPAGGLSARYQGGDVTETTKQPWNFEGSFKSYFVYDHGFDDVGRPTPRPPEGEEFDSRFRGHALFEHQHIFPDDWQAQIRAGYVSDQEFLEQWFPRDFDRDLPHDVSFYLKRQRDTEAFTVLAQFQPNGVVTTADLMQEQFEVEHLPEVGYRRVADGVLGNRATFYSENTLAGLHYQTTRYSLAEQGFFPPGITPGRPSLGTTGTTDDTIWRADFRQEIDFPLQAGPFKVVPYAIGRYSAYTDSPREGQINRLFGAIGARVTTAFWKVDDTVQSELLDLHRLRHVIEPELNVFTSATTVDRGEVFVFDERVDPINDVSAMQIGLRQRWQTYRGGPGRWRSVDFLTLNVEAVLFANQPPDDVIAPAGFRGMYFPSLPETSVPRNAINADMTWRIADTTAVLADVSWNADKRKLATASVGLVAQRDERMSYYIGNRYIDELNSNITTVAIDYQVSSKYNLSFAQSFDFGLGENVVSSIAVVRKFDTFFLVFKAFTNETTGQSGFGFNISPRWLSGVAADTDVVNSALETQRR